VGVGKALGDLLRHRRPGATAALLGFYLPQRPRIRAAMGVVYNPAWEQEHQRARVVDDAGEE
jgi:hypothetical protein